VVTAHITYSGESVKSSIVLLSKFGPILQEVASKTTISHIRKTLAKHLFWR
jgi:hypothetical protein